MDFSQYQGPVAEWEEFVRSTGFAQPPAATIKPQELRTVTNSVRVAGAQKILKETPGLLETVTWRDYSILTRDFQNITARVYKQRTSDAESTLLPVQLYFHGGGYLFGTVETEDASRARLVASYPSPGCIVVSVNYRHTPEYSWPTQFNDAWDSFEWLTAHISDIGGDPSQVIVSGISAGAGLAAAVVTKHNELAQADRLNGLLLIKGQILCCPWLLHPSANPFPKTEFSSFTQNQLAPVLPWSSLKRFADLLGPAAVNDAYFNTALNESEKVKGMPKTCFLVAGRDLLRDEGLAYAEKLKENGVPTKVHIFPGLPHGFRIFADLPSGQRWDTVLEENMQWCLSQDTSSSSHVEIH